MDGGIIELNPCPIRQVPNPTIITGFPERGKPGFAFGVVGGIEVGVSAANSAAQVSTIL